MSGYARAARAARETRVLGTLAASLCSSCMTLTESSRCCGAAPTPLDDADPSAVISAALVAQERSGRELEATTPTAGI